MSIYHKSAIVGAGLGLILAYFLYTNVAWYHDLVVWSWSSPWMWAIGLSIGIATAVLTDD